MKAIRIHEFGAEVLGFEEMEKPQPGADEVLTHVRAVPSTTATT
jgi:NADPH:quinone reductase-like Zn-dependent oxidoreductase